jgi:hypothetical protein
VAFCFILLVLKDEVMEMETLLKVSPGHGKQKKDILFLEDTVL